MKYLILTIFLPQILSQFIADMGMKPDVTFGDHNDRFDLASLVEQHNNNFDRFEEEEEDMRRYGNGKDLDLKTGKARKDAGDFAYHDEMNTAEGGTLAEFEENLQKFKVSGRRVQKLIDHLHGARNGRRSGAGAQDLEKEVLMHHALPVEMTIEGYLQPPDLE